MASPNPCMAPPNPCHMSSDILRLEKREIPTVSEFDEIRRDSYILREDSNGEVCFVIRDLENFQVLACIILVKLPFCPFSEKMKISRVLHGLPTC